MTINQYETTHIYIDFNRIDRCEDECEINTDEYKTTLRIQTDALAHQLKLSSSHYTATQKIERKMKRISVEVTMNDNEKNIFKRQRNQKLELQKQNKVAQRTGFHGTAQCVYVYRKNE